MTYAPPGCGPTLPPRRAVHALARELRELAVIAMDESGPGPHSNLRRALVQLERAQTMLNAQLAPHLTAVD